MRKSLEELEARIENLEDSVERLATVVKEIKAGLNMGNLDIDKILREMEEEK